MRRARDRAREPGRVKACLSCRCDRPRAPRIVRGGAVARALVVVESVAKATRIQGMLGPDYIVKPSIGHIRDLPQSAAEIPASVKGEKWARLGINVHDHFKPVYVVSSDRKKIVAELKAALKEVDELYLATDEDREGEAIALAPPGGAQPQGPGQADGLPRDHPGGDRQRGRRDPRPRPAPGRRPGGRGGSSTGWSATRSRRCCGARSTRPARPAGSSRWRSAWSVSASASAWRSPRRPGST